MILSKVIGWFSLKTWLKDNLSMLSYFIYILKILRLISSTAAIQDVSSTGEDANVCCGPVSVA